MFEATARKTLSHIPTEGEIAYFRERGTQFQMVQVVLSLAWWDTEPFSMLLSGEKRAFPGTGFSFFREKLADEMKLTLLYADGEGNRHRKEYTYFLQDLESTYDAISRSPSEEFLKTGVDELKNIGRVLSEVSRELRETRERVAHTTGIILSQTTLAALATNSDWKWSGQELGVHALINLLDIDSEAAIKIYQELFGASNIMSGKDTPLNEIDLPEELKSKVREHFRLSKEQLSADEDEEND